MNRARVTKALTRALTVVVALGCAATLCALLAPLHWFCELFCHFRAQGALWLGLCALAAFALRARRLGLVALVACLAHLVPLVPWYFGAPPAAPRNAPRWSAAFANVLTENPDHRTIATLLDTRSPELLALVETDARWLRDLSPVTGRYAYRLEHAREDHFGLALYSRYALSETEVAYLVPDAPPVLLATVEAPGAPVTVAVVHTTPPVGRAWSHLRDAMIEALARRVLARGGRALLLGDFNAVAWSPAFSGAFSEGGFVNGRQGLGVLTSWDAPLPGLAVPIDHAWARGGLSFEEFSVGPRFGSDHRPLFMRLATLQSALP